MSLSKTVVRRIALSLLAVLAIFLLLNAPSILDLIRLQQALEDETAAAQSFAPGAVELAKACVPCHGDRGVSLSSDYPSLAGLPASYIISQLEAFTADQRDAAQMRPLAVSLSQDQRQLLADYYSALPAKTPASHSGLESLQERHSMLASCLACHSSGTSDDRTEEAVLTEVPWIVGQGSHYLQKQLLAYRSGLRLDPAGTMNLMAKNLSDADIRILSIALSGESEQRSQATGHH